MGLDPHPVTLELHPTIGAIGQYGGEVMMKFKLNCGLVIALCLSTSVARADSLELKNGSLIKGKFMGGTNREARRCCGCSRVLGFGQGALDHRCQYPCGRWIKAL